MDTTEPWRHAFVEVGGVRFHYVEAGSGPLVVLLHGFPEFWWSWRHQIPALAARFRVVAPDLRGYNESDKPRGGYDVETLAGDTVGLVRALGETSCYLAGHDWGGVVAWETAARHPEAVRRLQILNAPHPTAMKLALRSSLAQLRRSWYVFFFQLPWLPERRLRRDDFAILDAVFREQMVHRERMTREDVDRYRVALARPGAIEAALEYYRQAFRDTLRDGFRASEVRVDVPTQVIWGEKDFALGLELLDGLDRWVPDLRVDRIPTASHWVQQDEPDLVTDLMLDFLRE